MLVDVYCVLVAADSEFINQRAINNSREHSSNNGTEIYNLPSRLWAYVIDEPLWCAGNCYMVKHLYWYINWSKSSFSRFSVTHLNYHP
jgi:hypothetical protein